MNISGYPITPYVTDPNPCRISDTVGPIVRHSRASQIGVDSNILNKNYIL